MKALGNRPADSLTGASDDDDLATQMQVHALLLGFSATGQLGGSLRSIMGRANSRSVTNCCGRRALPRIHPVAARVLDLVCLEFGFDLGHGYVDHEVERLCDLRRRRHHTCRSDDGRDRNKHALDVL